MASPLTLDQEGAEALQVLSKVACTARAVSGQPLAPVRRTGGGGARSLGCRASPDRAPGVRDGTGRPGAAPPFSWWTVPGQRFPKDAQEYLSTLALGTNTGA